MSKNKAADTSAQDTDAQTADNTNQEAAGNASTGVRSRRAIMLKEFIPSQDFINTQVVAKGKGTKVLLGRIFGFVTGVSEKTNTLPNGEKATSIVVHGQFESESYLTGEISGASTVYFPSSFAEAIKTQFAMDENLKVVQVDTDIGVEATGKPIPYTWVVVNHIEGTDQTPLRKLRAGRPRPALAAPAPVAQIASK